MVFKERNDFTNETRIDLVDIEKHFNDSGRASRDACCSPFMTKYGNTKTFYGGYTYAPDIYINNDKNATNNPNNIAQVESDPFYPTPTSNTFNKESSLTITHSFYSITSQVQFYDDPNFHGLIFGAGTYWIASRYAQDCDNAAIFGLRKVGGGGLSGDILFISTSGPNDNAAKVRPVTCLPFTVKLQLVSGSTNEWEIVKR